MTLSGRTLLAAVATATVAAAVIWGFLSIGSPKQERLRRLDNRRTTDLQLIYEATNEYWTRHKTLPPTLATLLSEPGLAINRKDPETGQPYDYRIIGNWNYELCAHFAQNSDKEQDLTNRGFWSHGAGRQCFRLDAVANR